VGAELVYLKGLSFWKCRGYVFVVNEKIMITSPIGIATGLPDVIRNVLPYLMILLHRSGTGVRSVPRLFTAAVAESPVAQHAALGAQLHAAQAAHARLRHDDIYLLRLRSRVPVVVLAATLLSFQCRERTVLSLSGEREGSTRIEPHFATGYGPGLRHLLQVDTATLPGLLRDRVGQH